MKNGKIAVAKNLTISPQLTRAQFLASKLGGSPRQVINNCPHTAFKFTAQMSVGVPCVFTLYFLDDSLREIMAYPLWTQPLSEWLDSQEALEQENKIKNDALLTELLGPPPYKYAWGEVLSVYDNKGGASCILVRFS